MNDKIIKLCNYLISNSFHEEADIIIKISNQVNDAWDQNAFKLKLEKEIALSKGMQEGTVEETEACNLVNFGINSLQSEKMKELFARNYPNMPEEINVIHFDLLKLFDCMFLNEDVQVELYKILQALELAGSGFRTLPYSKSTFLKIFDKFPNMKGAFEDLLKTDKINFVLIGTSDSMPNFGSQEIKGTLFHQRTFNHVVHDFGHSLFNHHTNITFRPIIILSEYCEDVLKEFTKSYLNKVLKALPEGQEKNALRESLDFSGIFAANQSVELPEFALPGFSALANQVDEKLYKGKATDFRFLVSTTQKRGHLYSNNLTELQDFDQDVFSYIMLSSTNNFKEIFKNPALPPNIEEFFDDFIKRGLLTPEDKTSFDSYIKQNHAKAVQSAQDDVEKIIKDQGGYINYLSKISKQDEDATNYFKENNPDYKLSFIVSKSEPNNEGMQGEQSVVYLFDMVGARLIRIRTLLHDNLLEKGYLKEMSSTDFGRIPLNNYIFDENEAKLDYSRTPHTVYDSEGRPGTLIKVKFIFSSNHTYAQTLNYTYEDAVEDLKKQIDGGRLERVGKLINPEKDVFYMEKEYYRLHASELDLEFINIANHNDITLNTSSGKKNMYQVNLGKLNRSYNKTGYIFDLEEKSKKEIEEKRIKDVLVNKEENFFHEYFMRNPYYSLLLAILSTESCYDLFSRAKQMQILGDLANVAAVHYASIGITVNAINLENAIDDEDSFEALLAIIGLTLNAFQLKVKNVQSKTINQKITLDKNNTKTMLLEEIKDGLPSSPTEAMLDSLNRLEELNPGIINNNIEAIETTFQEK